MTQDEKYMSRCLFLAKAGIYAVPPNPMVGAVVVHNGRIIGEGYHRRYGESHAEPNAISAVKNSDLLAQSTLYVNLEPCAHHGKTPPCAALIVDKGIRKVVVACLDPNPKVAGKGVEMLRNGGVEVVVGVLESQARLLNRRFITFHEKKRPYIILKWAQTADGFIDRRRDNHFQPALRVSNEITTRLTHKMRAENMAIMAGSNTVLLDNPSLSVRHWRGNNPTRVIFDRHNLIPDTFKVKQEEIKTLIFSDILNQHPMPWVEYLAPDNSSDRLKITLDQLYNRNIHSLLVEGGTQLINSFIDSNLWDEANVEISTQAIHDGVRAPHIKPDCLSSTRSVDGHRWNHYHNNLFYSSSLCKTC